VGPLQTVGHAPDLGELMHAWSRVRGSGSARPVTAIITGPAGIGKSRLVNTAVDALDPAPAVVLTGAARVHSPSPYDWLAAVLGPHDTTGLQVPPDAMAWLAQHPDVPRERYAPDTLLRIAVKAVRELVGAGPAAVVVEDLHALDPASLNLVAELAATPGLPAMMMVTSRLPAGAGLVASTLARLTGAAGATRVHLRPLARDDVAALLADAYPHRAVTAAMIDAACTETGGNPYKLIEFVALTGPDLGVAADACLTAREMEVLRWVASGMPNKQIARVLGISVRTVTVHVSNVLRKTGCASRTDAALWAVGRRPAQVVAGR
jgi:DNA-binding CsgD family transcriptional regulator